MFRESRGLLLMWCASIILVSTLLTFVLLQEIHGQYGEWTGSLQKEQFSFRLRDNNRKEGILRRRPVSSEIDLISATIEYQDQTETTEDTDSCFVGFFLQQESKVQITVQEPEIGYRMETLQRASSGFSKFGWPRDAVLVPLRIDLYNLYAKAEIQNSDPLMIAPIVLFYRNPPSDTIKGYRFIFQIDTGSDFRYHILKPTPNGYEIIYENQLLAQPPGKVLVTWDCKDRHGQLIEDGLYQLNIIITLHSYYQADRKVVFIRDFYHKCKVT